MKKIKFVVTSQNLCKSFISDFSVKLQQTQPSVMSVASLPNSDYLAIAVAGFATTRVESGADQSEGSLLAFTSLNMNFPYKPGWAFQLNNRVLIWQSNALDLTKSRWDKSNAPSKKIWHWGNFCFIEHEHFKADGRLLYDRCSYHALASLAIHTWMTITCFSRIQSWMFDLIESWIGEVDC